MGDVENCFSIHSTFVAQHSLAKLVTYVNKTSESWCKDSNALLSGVLWWIKKGQGHATGKG